MHMYYNMYVCMYACMYVCSGVATPGLGGPGPGHQNYTRILIMLIKINNNNIP